MDHQRRFRDVCRTSAYLSRPDVIADMRDGPLRANSGLMQCSKDGTCNPVTPTLARISSTPWLPFFMAGRDRALWLCNDAISLGCPHHQVLVGHVDRAVSPIASA